MEEPILLNNRYQLQNRQATGGMATVYRATDLMLERTVAIKLLRADFSADPEFTERFRQEAKAAAKLSHPNIVTVHDFGIDQGQLFIVMEYVPGMDLKMILKNRGRLSIDEALSLMIQACSGIGYAHRSGIVHCDIKPQNMLVTPDQLMKVVDFGIARAFASIPSDEKASVVWGSPQYFSPEQSSGLPPGPASDVYSLGVVLFEMVTGQLPFNGSTAEELARQHREVLPASPRRLNPEIPPALEQIILKVLAKEPSARYRTANQLGQILISVQQPAIANGVTSNQSPPTVEMSLHQTLPNGSEGSISSGASYPTYYAPVSQSTSDRPSITDAAPPDEISSSAGIDWITWLLALFVLVALIGLIPFWLWVYTVLNPPF
jgi:eukaryotic-like serine/threonine-protein kinase